MGIPIWSPSKNRHEQTNQRILSRQRLLQVALMHQQPHRSHSRLQRRRSAAEPFYIETESIDGYTDHRPPEQPSSTQRQQEIDRQMELRFTEKKELLDQLKITTSLLDQFLVMTDLSSHGLTLPPIITDDLVAILAATSASLNTTATHTSVLSSLSSSPASSSTNNNIITRGRRHIDFRSLQSHNNSTNDTTVTNLVDTVIRSPSHAARWADLESDIASIHQRVIDQLILLGASVSAPIPIPLQQQQQQTSLNH